MDWIEKIFGISPDGGDGTLEALFVIVTVVALAMVAVPRVRAYARGGPARHR
jgi:hypothetical protein